MRIAEITSLAGAQRQETFACVDTVPWLAVTVIVPVTIFLPLLLT